MTSSCSHSRGVHLHARFQQGLREAERAARPGARNLLKLRGITPNCHYSQPLENVLIEARELLVNSQKVYIYHNDVVMEVESEDVRCLVSLTTGHRIEPIAPSLLANLVLCAYASPSNSQEVQFAPPHQFVATLLNSSQVRDHLPRIKTYARLPVFDDGFQLRGPGWHPDIGLLVHGPDVEVIPPVNQSGAGPARDRLPPRLRELLSDFCLTSDADVANVIGVLLTAILMPHFMNTGKPIILLDANQPGTGKTLLAICIGLILDGRSPRVTSYSSDDEELGKRVCAVLRDNHQSQVIIDNAKAPGGTAISSAFLEANSTALVISLRILGQSSTFERPNDLLWFLTMNGTLASPDIVSRCLPIQFLYHGDPGRRTFGGCHPVEFARRHRVEILGELVGMVMRWTQSGRLRGRRGHRLTHWAEIVGGILEANHLPEFMNNVDDAAVEFNASLDSLGALAEECIRRGTGFAVLATGADPVAFPLPTISRPTSRVGVPPADWEPVFRAAGVLDQELSAASGSRGKSTKIGRFLAQHVGQEVQVEQNGVLLRAHLQMAEGRARQKHYSFVVTQTNESQEASLESTANTPPVAGPNPSTELPGGEATSPITPGNDEPW